jgi:hypothetical protein
MMPIIGKPESGRRIMKIQYNDSSEKKEDGLIERHTGFQR